MEDDSDKALKYALNILNRKDYTEFEMVQKLKIKGFKDDTSKKVISYLKQHNFINDDRYAENFVYFKIKNGYGKKRIGYELKQRGIDEKTAEKYLNQADERETAKKLFEAKYKSLKNDKNKKGKIFSYLARRGYDYDLINELLNKNEEG